MPGAITKIGVISDTQGVLRNQVKNMFTAVRLLVHGGDTGNPKMIQELDAITQTTACEGSQSRDWTRDLSTITAIETEGQKAFALNDLA